MALAASKQRFYTELGKIMVIKHNDLRALVAGPVKHSDGFRSFSVFL